MAMRYWMAALLCLGAAPSLAQDTDAEAEPGPCDAAPYTDFDFWVGDWDVHGGDGTLQGRNRISKVENGCLVLEEWTSVNGNTGQSYNFYDPGIDAWRQVWVSQGITVDYKGGLDAPGAMVLFGDIAYRSGDSFPFMGRWEVMEDGSVRQHFEQYDPEAGDWTDWFTGYYTPATDAPAD